MNTSMRNIVLWALIFVGLFMVFDSQQQTSSTAISYSDLLSRVDNGQISQVTIQGQELIYALDIGTRSVIGMLGTVEGDRVQKRRWPSRHSPWRAIPCSCVS